MHYTSWDRTNREQPVLLAEAGPQALATFGPDAAQVGAESWPLSASATGASMRTSAGEATITGRLGRDKRLSVETPQGSYTFINEASSDWVVVDAHDNKVAQFSGKNSGVRAAILEFEGETALDTADVIALSWFSRLVLEAKTSGSAVAIIATLVLASLVAVAAFLF